MMMASYFDMRCIGHIGGSILIEQKGTEETEEVNAFFSEGLFFGHNEESTSLTLAGSSRPELDIANGTRRSRSGISHRWNGDPPWGKYRRSFLSACLINHKAEPNGGCGCQEQQAEQTESKTPEILPE
jgi:hypothetical protein